MPKVTTPQTSDTPTCLICERIGGSMCYLGFGKYRHDSEDCRPGGCNWREWYDGHPTAHTDAGDIIREFHQTR